MPEASVTVPVPMVVAAPMLSVPAPTVAFQAVALLPVLDSASVPVPVLVSVVVPETVWSSVAVSPDPTSIVPPSVLSATSLS